MRAWKEDGEDGLWESLQENREEAGERQEAENALKVGNLNAGGLGQGVGSIVQLKMDEFQVPAHTLLEMDLPLEEEFWSSRGSLLLAGDRQRGLCRGITEG